MLTCPIQSLSGNRTKIVPSSARANRDVTPKNTVRNALLLPANSPNAAPGFSWRTFRFPQDLPRRIDCGNGDPFYFAVRDFVEDLRPKAAGGFEDGGHTCPGSFPIPRLGNTTTDLDATDAMWDFFVAHPKA